MTLFVRKINFQKWVPENPLTALDDDDIEADPVGDLATENNSLSIFAITDDATALRAAAAIIIGRGGKIKWQELGYVIIPEELLHKLDIEPIPDPPGGDTKDNEVNKWHINIGDLSGKKVVHLAKAINDECSLKQIFPAQLYVALATCVREGGVILKDIQDKDARNEVSKLL